tara:strand:+ start:207 stop:614 length:408 start_codon:yes stop_codon:yes gene_type:complete
MNLSELLNQITTLQTDSETLQKVKSILQVKTEDIVDTIELLQKNAIPTNLASLKKEIANVRFALEESQDSHSRMHDSVSDAMSSLEDVPYNNDEIDEAMTRVDDLQLLLNKKEEEEVEAVEDKDTDTTNYTSTQH